MAVHEVKVNIPSLKKPKVNEDEFDREFNQAKDFFGRPEHLNDEMRSNISFAEEMMKKMKLKSN